MIARSELINVSEGAGRLELRGTTSAFALFVDDRPVAANWLDCKGSIGQYFYRVPDCPVEKCVALAREAVGDAPIIDRPLADRFRPLLDQFACGTYRLDYDEASGELGFWELEYTSDFDSNHYIYNYSNYIGTEHALLPTQNRDTLDQNRILEWAVAIEAGQRPTVITTMIDGADTELVLDGHHKLVGYDVAGVPARRLAIVFLDPAPLRVEDWPGGRVPDGPDSWPKAMAFRPRPRLWPRDAHPSDVAFENQRRVEIARRLGDPSPNLIGFLEASYVYLYDYSPDFMTKEPRGWITSPATLELLEPRAEVGFDGSDIVKVGVVESRTSSGDGLLGWVPLIATTFTEYFDSGSRMVEFRNKKLGWP